MALDKRKILQAAQKHLQKGALDKALKEYQQLLAEDARDANVRLKLGDVHLRLEDRVAALSAYLAVAEQFMTDGFDAKAVAIYKQIQKIDPSRGDCFEPLADLYQRLGLIAEAMNALQSAADVCRRAGKQDESLTLVRRMGELDPTNTASRRKVVELLLNAGLQEEGLSELEDIATTLRGQGENSEAYATLERVLDTEPKRASALEDMSRAFLADGDAQKAEEFARRLTEAQPSMPDGLELLAEILRQEEREEELPQVYRDLAAVFRNRGDLDQAREILQRHVPGEALIDENDVLRVETATEAPDMGADLPLDPGAAPVLGDEIPSFDLDGSADDAQALEIDEFELEEDATPEASTEAPAILEEPEADALSFAMETPDPLPDALAAPNVEPSDLEPPGLGDLTFEPNDLGVGSEISPLDEIKPSALTGEIGAPELTDRETESAPSFDPDDSQRRHSFDLDAPELGIGDDAAFGQSDQLVPEPPASSPEPEATTSVPFEMAATGDLDPHALGSLDEALDLDDSPWEVAEEKAASDIDPTAFELDASSAGGHEDSPPEPLELDPDPEVDLAASTEIEIPPEPEPDPEPLADAVEVPAVPDPPTLADVSQLDLAGVPSRREDDTLVEQSVPTAPPAVGAQQILDDLAEADFHFHQGLHEEAESIYQRILGVAPHHPQALLRLGEIAAARGEQPGESQGDWTGGLDAREETAPVYPGMDLEPSSSESSDGDEDDFATFRDLPDINTIATPPEETTSEPPREVTFTAAPLPVEPEEPACDVQAPQILEPERMKIPAIPEPPLAPIPTQISEERPEKEPEAAVDAREVPCEATAPVEVVAEEPAAMKSSTDEIPVTEGAPDSPGGDFDLAAELSGVLDTDGATKSKAAATVTDLEVLDAIFSDFKKGVDRTLGSGDHQTHYDLGIAYREMGLSDDALAEFHQASAAPELRRPCLQLMGLCALDLLRPTEAIAHLEEALSTPALEPGQQAGLRFDLGRAFFDDGDSAKAREEWERVLPLDPGFPQVRERLAQLNDASDDLAEQPPANEFEDFDDLVAEIEAEDAAEADAQLAEAVLADPDPKP